jgi:hypothetical protein
MPLLTTRWFFPNVPARVRGVVVEEAFWFIVFDGLNGSCISQRGSRRALRTISVHRLSDG